MRINWSKAVLAGVAGTLVMTGVGVWIAPMMGIPRMNPAEMLAQPMGGSLMMGWVGHLMIGIVLAVMFAAVVGRLPGPAWARGATFAVAPYLMAQVIVMPMMGMPIFSGSIALGMGSLIGHLIYGATVGAIYGSAATAPAGRAVSASASH